MTYASKVLVEQFDVPMNDLKRQQLVVLLLDGAAKVETGVAFVDDLIVLPLEKAAHLLFTRQNRGDELARYLLLLLISISGVPFL